MNIGTTKPHSTSFIKYFHLWEVTKYRQAPFTILLRVTYASNAFTVKKLGWYYLEKKWKINDRTPCDIDFVNSSKGRLAYAG